MTKTYKLVVECDEYIREGEGGRRHFNVEVEANSADEAIAKVTEQYKTFSNVVVTILE